MADWIPALLTIVSPILPFYVGIRRNNARFDELLAHMDAQFEKLNDARLKRIKGELSS